MSLPVSLRARLLITVAGLLAVVSVAAGVAIRIELHRYLVNRLDSQVTAANGRNDHALGHGPMDVDHDGGGSGSSYQFPPGSAVGTLAATITGTSVGTASVLAADNEAAAATSLSASATRTLLALPADGKPRTRNLDGLGSYRLVASNHGNGTTLVTGLSLAGVNETINRLTVFGGLIAGGLILAAIVVGGVLVRLTLRPLRRVASTAMRVSELPLATGEVELPHRVPDAQIDTKTEVGQVGAAMNRLLDHVDAALTARQASEMRVRQFVADASHELRTPLASIRGYAELCRRTGAKIPPDVAHALQRVESESARMTVLVEDLLLLARLDSGRPLAQEAVDLTALLVDVVSDAHAAGPDHDWRLDVPEEPVITTGDPQRLHQVIVNLLTNARMHTPPGTIVLATLKTVDSAGGSAEISVTDNGPGIPPDLRAHVFERFARGDSSRSRAQGSSGLGLAIVEAVVVAHGGTIDLSSAPGRTEFRVLLPMNASAAPSHPVYDRSAPARRRAETGAGIADRNPVR